MKSVIRSILVLIFCATILCLIFSSQTFAESPEAVSRSMEASRLAVLNDSKISATNGVLLTLCCLVVYLLKYKSATKLFTVDRDIKKIVILGVFLAVIYVLIGVSGMETMDHFSVLHNLQGFDIFFTVFWISFFDDIVLLDILFAFVVIPFVWSFLSLLFLKKKATVRIRQVLMLAIFLYWGLLFLVAVLSFFAGYGIYPLLEIFSWLIPLSTYYYLIGGIFGGILVREECKEKSERE